jgi:hypothetical protein
MEVLGFALREMDWAASGERQAAAGRALGDLHHTSHGSWAIARKRRY